MAFDCIGDIGIPKHPVNMPAIVEPHDEFMGAVQQVLNSNDGPKARS